MLSATFWVEHKPSQSRAIIEFGLQNKKVKITNLYFIQGNILDINVVRVLKKQATNLFSKRNGPYLPFTG